MRNMQEMYENSQIADLPVFSFKTRGRVFGNLNAVFSDFT